MTNQDQNYDQWQPVPKGTLAKYASRNARKSSYRRLAAVIGMAAMVLLGIYVFIPSQLGPNEPNYGGITCSQVRRNLSAYKSASLDASIRNRIDEHLRRCSICQQLVARSQPNAASNSSLALRIPSRRY
jgi:Putative zinc-finger